MERRKIQTFNHGLCGIYRIGGDEKISPVLEGIRFEDQTVGSKRFFKARDFQQTASRMIRIPLIPKPKANDVIVIEGTQYNMIQVQSIYDTYPKCWQITLEEIRKNRELEHG